MAETSEPSWKYQTHTKFQSMTRTKLYILVMEGMRKNAEDGESNLIFTDMTINLSPQSSDVLLYFLIPTKFVATLTVSIFRTIRYCEYNKQ